MDSKISREYTIFQLWALSEVKTFTAFMNWLRRRDWPAYNDPARGVVVQVPEE